MKINIRKEGISMKFPIRKNLPFEKKERVLPGTYISEIVKAETPEGYAEDAAVQLTYELRDEEDGEVIATTTEIMPFTSQRWFDFEDKLIEAGLEIDDTDELVGVVERQVYKRVAASNGRCYTNIVDREVIGVAEQ
ncbi:MAG: hypothetical protein E7583_02710 [Ruminococcaceae bacterium]|nr:hypothetical protein [Oscillospiraceae bacterium]